MITVPVPHSIPSSASSFSLSMDATTTTTPSDAISRNLAAFLQSSAAGNKDTDDQTSSGNLSSSFLPFIAKSAAVMKSEVVQRHPELHAALQSQQQQQPQALPKSESQSLIPPGPGVVQQIAQSDIVTVQPRKPPSAGGRGTVGLAVHVDGYLYHGKKTRLDGTKLLYCLDRTKYNCMAVAELFPSGAFRAKRPHTGHAPNPEECEVRLAKRLMRERAREHPEFTSKEIIRDILADPTLSDEAKQRLSNYTSLRKFVSRGRQSHRKAAAAVTATSTNPVQQLQHLQQQQQQHLQLLQEARLFDEKPMLDQINSFGSAELAALFAQVAAASAVAPVMVSSAFSTTMPCGNLATFPSPSSANDELARLVRELQRQQQPQPPTPSLSSAAFLAKDETDDEPIAPVTAVISTTTVQDVALPACSAASCSSSSGGGGAPSTSSAAGGVWQTVEVDVIDFSRMPDDGNAYIFHARDTVSRFSYASAMEDACAPSLLAAIKKLFFFFGPAHVVRIDASFREHALEADLALLFPLTTVDYIVERKTPSGALIPRREAAMMKERIFAWIIESGRKDWSRALPEIKYAHNTEWIEEIESTPLEKFFARHLPTATSAHSASSRFSAEENNESHDGMSDDCCCEESVVGGQFHHDEIFDLSQVKSEPLAERAQ